MVSRMEKKPKGETDLVVFCHGAKESPRTSESMLTHVICLQMVVRTSNMIDVMAVVV